LVTKNEDIKLKVKVAYKEMHGLMRLQSQVEKGDGKSDGKIRFYSRSYARTCTEYSTLKTLALDYFVYHIAAILLEKI